MGYSWWEAPTEHNAYQLSIVSVIVTFVAAIFGLAGYVRKGSSLLLCYGLENLVDVISSVVVLWRFYCPGEADPDLVQKLEKREKKASVAISFVLFILGIGIIIAAADQIKLGATYKESTSLIITISFISIMVFGSFTIVKLQYATMLNSPALHKDGFCSFIGTALSFSLFMDTLLAIWDPTTWWLEPLIAIVVGLLSLCVGLRSIVRNIFFQHVPIYKLSWWTSEAPLSGDSERRNPNTQGSLYDDGTAVNEVETTTIGGSQRGDKELI